MGPGFESQRDHDKHTTVCFLFFSAPQIQHVMLNLISIGYNRIPVMAVPIPVPSESSSVSFGYPAMEGNPHDLVFVDHCP